MAVSYRDQEVFSSCRMLFPKHNCMLTSLYLCTCCPLIPEFLFFSPLIELQLVWKSVITIYNGGKRGRPPCSFNSFHLQTIFCLQTIIYDLPSPQLKHNGRENTQRRKRWGLWETIVGQLICFCERRYKVLLFCL